jgi:hypothetical protein
MPGDCAMASRSSECVVGPRLQTPTSRVSELHAFELGEYRSGILLVACLASIVGTQRHTVHAGELLGCNLGKPLSIQPLPNISLGFAAIHLALRKRGRAGERTHGDENSHQALHVLSPCLAGFCRIARVEKSIARHSLEARIVVGIAGIGENP